VLKRIGGLSKSMIDKTRSMLSSSDQMPATVILPREDHTVSSKSISANALKVLNRLHEGGFAAYLVGGGVRDVLVGLKPKDFDVATDASPEQVRSLFRNSRIIGRRFRLVHVVYGRDIIEVATFRASHDKGTGGEVGEAGRIVRDNVFGTIEEDAIRRDFSVNALYYNIADHSVVDYVGGLQDLDQKLFRLIGDPVTRCEEDPVRVLRAVRLAAKLDFDIAPATLKAMQQTAPLLANQAPARMFDEVLKLFQGGYSKRSFAAVREHELLEYLFPMLYKRLEEDSSPQNEAGNSGSQSSEKQNLEKMLNAALVNTDKRVSQGKPITPYYLLAFMLWPDVEAETKQYISDGKKLADALTLASEDVLKKQLAVMSIPKRLSGPMREVWQLQPRLEQWRGKRALKLMEGRRFRAAYDFLCLRSTIEPELVDVAAWWTEVQEVDFHDRLDYTSRKKGVYGLWGEAKPEGASKKKRRRRRAGSTNKPANMSADKSADKSAAKSAAKSAKEAGGNSASHSNNKQKKKPGQA